MLKELLLISLESSWKSLLHTPKIVGRVKDVASTQIGDKNGPTYSESDILSSSIPTGEEKTPYSSKNLESKEKIYSNIKMMPDHI